MRGAPVKEKNRRWLGHGGVRDVLPTQQMLAIARVDLLLLWLFSSAYCVLGYEKIMYIGT